MRKNKIRILHVAQAAGGVDRYIRMLLKYLDKEKFENILGIQSFLGSLLFRVFRSGSSVGSFSRVWF